MRYALGMAEHEPFDIWVYATREEYLKRSEAMAWSGGIFRHSNQTAYFYGGPSTTMYHEFTHQVLHVLTGKNRAPNWLTEGIAVHTQYVQFDIDGARFPGAPKNGNWSLDEVLSLTSHKDWNRAVETSRRNGNDSPYGSSGSLVTFAMQYRDGTLSPDFVDFLRDSYRGQDGRHKIWDYMGIPEPVFRKAYADWLNE